MKLDIGIGQSTQPVTVPDENLIKVLMANPVEQRARHKQLC